MVTMGFSMMMPLLFVHIFHIILMCANEQMIFSHTSWVIAFMKNVLIAGAFAVVQLPGNTRCKPPMPINGEIPIPMRSQCTVPIPATIGFIDLFPKSIFNRTTYTMGRTGKTRTALRTILSIAIGRYKCYATLFASKRRETLRNRILSHYTHTRTVDIIRVFLCEQKGLLTVQTYAFHKSSLYGFAIPYYSIVVS